MGIYCMYQIKFIDGRFKIKIRLILVFVWNNYDLFEIFCGLEIINSEVIYMYYVLIVIKI